MMHQVRIALLIYSYPLISSTDFHLSYLKLRHSTRNTVRCRDQYYIALDIVSAYLVLGIP